MSDILIKSPIDFSLSQNSLSALFSVLKKNETTVKSESLNARLGYWSEIAYRFLSHKAAVVSLAIITLIVFFAITGPNISAYTYSEQNLAQKNYAPRIPKLEKLGIFTGEEKIDTTSGVRINNGYVKNGDLSVYYWFGSDTLGRDIWTRTWEGTQVSLYIAFVAIIIDMLFGLTFGLISGYFGGWIDGLMQRFVEIINGIPNLVIVTLLMIVLKPGMYTIIFALILTHWVGMSRIARAEMLKLKNREFILASRTLGASSFHIIFKDVLPNCVGQVITRTMFSIPSAIFMEAFLSFVGLGIPVPQCSLGSLISEAFNSFTTHPYQILPPVIVLALLMLCFNLLADGLRETFDPKFAAA